MAVEENGEMFHILLNLLMREIPLVILSVKLAVVLIDWSKDPIKSGSKGYIVVEYNPGRPGVFRKSLAVVSNSETNSQKLSTSTYIYIKGKVSKNTS